MVGGYLGVTADGEGRTLAVLFVLFDRAVAGEFLCGANAGVISARDVQVR